MARIKDIINERFNSSSVNIKSDMDLRADLAIDSLDAVELIVELENEFKINITDDEADKLFSVGDVIECVARKMV